MGITVFPLWIVILGVFVGLFAGGFIAWLISESTFDKRKDEYILGAMLAVSANLVRRDIQHEGALEEFREQFTCPKCHCKYDMDKTERHFIGMEGDKELWELTCSKCGTRKIIDLNAVLKEEEDDE